MIVQDIYIRHADWHVRIYHAVDRVYADEILDELINLGCRGKNLNNAKKSLWNGLPNNGITYSNTKDRMTVIVIGITTNACEYWNSIDHEKLHLLQDISMTCGIDPYGEDIAYISGECLRAIYSAAKYLLCDCCRNKKHHTH